MDPQKITERVDWFVWEDVDTAYMLGDDSTYPVTDEEWATLVIPESSNGHAGIVAPIGRYSDNSEVIVVDTPCTLRSLLEAVHGFYNTVLKHLDDIEDLEETVYLEDVADKLRRGGTAKRHELNGVAEYRRPLKDGERRHPLGDCQGCLRFEGIRHGNGDFFGMEIGS